MPAVHDYYLRRAMSNGRDRWRQFTRAKEERDVAFMLDWLEHFPEESAHAARCLCEWGGIEAVPAFIRMLSSGQIAARRTGARSLERLGSPGEARASLTQAAAGDSDVAVRGWALAAIGAYQGDPQAEAVLLAGLADPSVRVKNGAAVGLKKFGDRSLVDRLVRERARIRRRPLAWYWCRRTLTDAINSLR